MSVKIRGSLIAFLFIFIRCEQNETCIICCEDVRVECEYKTYYSIQNNCTNPMVVVGYLDDNRFSNVQNLFDYLEKLEELHLQNNSIDELGNLGNKLHQLVRLYLGYNNIRSVTGDHLKHFTSLKFLSLAHNMITRIEAKCFPEIIHLDLSENIITEIHEHAFLGNSMMMWLYLQSNGISDLTFLKPLVNLQCLDLSSNSIRVLPPNVFSNFTKLRVLKLSFNKLTRIKFGTFSQNRELQTLDVSNNQLLQMWTYPLLNFRLLSLDVRYNRLKELDIMTYKQMGFSGNCTCKTEVSIDYNRWDYNFLLGMAHINCVKLNYNNTIVKASEISSIDQIQSDINTELPVPVAAKIEYYTYYMNFLSVLLVVLTAIIAAILWFTSAQGKKVHPSRNIAFSRRRKSFNFHFYDSSNTN